MASRVPIIRGTAPIEELDVVPQAIFGRPIQYFTLDYNRSHDDLDVFEYAAFSMDNECHFCLRHYSGHPKKTVTLYLEYGFEREPELRSVIRGIVHGFHMPATAIHWQRGDHIRLGSIMPLKGRLHESEARILALKIALTRPDGHASTSYIKEQTTHFIPLTEEDLKPSPTRQGEEKWQQVVGNVISHQKQGTSIFSRHLATRARDGIQITDRGREYLADMGFCAASKS
jgi:hypothetical protein